MSRLCMMFLACLVTKKEMPAFIDEFIDNPGFFEVFYLF
jgi:hypothetical protein